MKKTSEFLMPKKFQIILDRNTQLKIAFKAGTPGRRRGYLFLFSTAKNAKTGVALIEKHLQDILEG